MSQHYYRSSHQGQLITILMGWDRPLQGFFMVIELAEKEGYFYTNLDDPALLPFNGLPDSLDHFQEKLNELGLSVPTRMIQEIQEDAAMNTGNRYVHYEQDGTIRA